MKALKKFSIYSLLVLGATSLSFPSFASSAPAVYVDTEKVYFEEGHQPYIHTDDYTLIPFRAVGEVLDLSLTWESPYVIAEGIHKETGQQLTVRLGVGNSTITINDETTFIDTPIELNDSRTYIPLRLFAETFGFSVDWETGKIYIKTPEQLEEPDVPTEPEQPEEPDIPTEPEQPDVLPTEQPDVPTGPEQPEEPDVPTEPEQPEEPDVPTEPEQPEEPDVPVWPEIPTLPIPPTEPEEPDNPDVPTEPGTPSVHTFEREVADLVNQERAKSGLQPLTLDTKLSSVAREKSRDMRIHGYFDHTSPTYGSPFDMLKQFGISYTRAAENIAMGYASPESVVTGWMNSPGHRKNILDPNLTHIGVGYDSQGHYWTQLFITP